VVPVLAAPADPSDVSLSMPSFAIDAPLGSLQAWKPLTVPGGSYAPMTDESAAQPRRVDALQQRTVVAVDAAGTSLPEPDASARPGSVAGEGEPFVVGRPFAFVIHDVETGIPMIVGWVREAPTSR
jgi:serpin B